MENNPFPEKLITYTDILRGIGEVALITIKGFFTRHQETALHRPDHYRATEAIKDVQLIFSYDCDGGDLPLGDYPPYITKDDLPKIDRNRTIPPFDSEGRCL